MDISIDDLLKKIKYDDLIIIDIRSRYEYELGHIPKSKNIPLNHLLSNINLYFDNDKTYYVYCDYGNLSKSLVKKLNRSNIINILGGYNSFKNIYKNL